MKRKIALSVLVVFSLVVAFLVTIASPVTPAQATITGPATNLSSLPDRGSYLIRIYRNTALAANSLGTSTAFAGPAYSRADIQYRLRGISTSALNTVTLQLMYSNDATSGAVPTDLARWVPGPTIVSSSGVNTTTDSTDMTETYNFGYWTAISVTLINANPVNVEVWSLFK